MEFSDYTGKLEHTRGENIFTPSVWIAIRNQTNALTSSDRQFVATIMGLQALKCSGVLGYGNTEEEAVRNLRRKVLQYLDFNGTYEARD